MTSKDVKRFSTTLADTSGIISNRMEEVNTGGKLNRISSLNEYFSAQF